MEPIKSNLEPIEDADLNLKEKLKSEDVGGSSFEEEVDVFKIEKETPLEKSGAEKDDAYMQIMAKLGDEDQSGSLSDDVPTDAHSASSLTDAESQISHLVDLAMTKGVIYAVKVARHMEDNYILDTFHDKLMADELHDALVEKGLLKNS